MKNIFIPLLAAGMFCYSCNPHSDSAATTATDTTKASLDTVATAPVQAQSMDVIGTDLLKNEQFGTIKIGHTAAQVKEALGAPDKKGEQAEWEADGEMHQTWIYKGIEIDMIGKEQTVNSINITAPSTLKTSKNIGIGSSKAEVETAYAGAIDKTATEEGSEDLIAGTVYGGIIFKIENGKVSGIFAGAAAE